jgi:hypothetical protein
MMRFDLGISRTQCLVEYQKVRGIGIVNLPGFVFSARNCIAEVYQDTGVWRKARARGDAQQA